MRDDINEAIYFWKKIYLRKGRETNEQKDIHYGD